MTQDRAREIIADMKLNPRVVILSVDDANVLIAHIAAAEAENTGLSLSLEADALALNTAIRERDELAKALENTAYLLDLMKRYPIDRHRLTYTNWRGETSVRELHLCGLYMGSTEWHPERQMLLKAFDWEKDAYRDFAVKDFDFSDALAHLKENSNG